MEYLTFKLDGDEFAVDVLKTREIVDLRTVTKVPQSPDFMLGVINLRGSVVPVIDLRLKFGMEKVAAGQSTSIVVMDVLVGGETLIVGAMVDSVEEVLGLDDSQIEPAPRIGTRLNTEFIKGMGKQDEQFLIILDIDRVFSTDELAMVQGAAEQPAFAE
ncbi:MAG: chemotaxis protein CheW [Desulfuromonadales bacterium]|jgi:purine-binding chemotaxis protein CheW|nr:chemotaxis protein CheW [Desulfuromonadales bacterium]